MKTGRTDQDARGETRAGKLTDGSEPKYMYRYPHSQKGIQVAVFFTAKIHRGIGAERPL